MTGIKRLLLIGFFGMILTACTTVSHTLVPLGTSHELAKANQTLNPEASANLQSVSGMDAGAAKLAIDRYRGSFEEAPTRTEFVLPVGGRN